MKSHTEYMWFETKNKREYINITREVEAELQKSGIQEGFALVSAMHITAGVYVNDAESGLIGDIDGLAMRSVEQHVAFVDIHRGGHVWSESELMGCHRKSSRDVVRHRKMPEQ